MSKGPIDKSHGKKYLYFLNSEVKDVYNYEFYQDKKIHLKNIVQASGDLFARELYPLLQELIGDATNGTNISKTYLLKLRNHINKQLNDLDK